MHAKKNDVSVKPGIYFDSARGDFFQYYRLDVNKDNVPDIKIGWNIQPFSIRTTTYYAISLHPQAAIHVSEYIAGVCRDTTPLAGGAIHVNTHNCDGGSSLIEVDTIKIVPNLDSIAMSSTPFITNISDSVLIFRNRFAMPMPFIPYMYTYEINHGFFEKTYSGYMLIRVNGKRYGLKLIYSHFYYIENFFEIDP